MDTSRIAMLLAVLYRHGGLNLLANDVYVSTIAGGVAREPACDLAVVAALAGAASTKPLPRTTCVIGEISLTGQIRPVPRLEWRLKEAARLGFTRAVIPVPRKAINVPGMELVTVRNVREALQSLGLVRK